MKEHIQTVGFEIIRDVSEAKKIYLEAIELSKDDKFKEALNKVHEADKIFNVAHQHHLEFAKREAQGEDIPYSILFVHAEDQLLMTELLRITVLELIELREEIRGLTTNK